MQQKWHRKLSNYCSKSSMALISKSEVGVARVWEKRQQFVFNSKVAFLLKKLRFFRVQGFREVILSFVNAKIEKRVGQLKMCPKVSHTRLSVKWLAIGFLSSWRKTFFIFNCCELLHRFEGISDCIAFRIRIFITTLYWNWKRAQWRLSLLTLGMVIGHLFLFG